MPTISVIIPTYNRPELLRKALDSVLQQTYRDLEVIVVDDGSCEETHLCNLKLLQMDNRVRYVYKKESCGVAAARNDGIRIAEGRYVAFLDDDDIWLPMKLEKQVQFMASCEHLAAVCCGFGFVDGDGKSTNPVGEMRNPLTSKKKLFKSYSGRRTCYLIERDALYKIVLIDCLFHLSSTAMIKRQCLASVGLFDETLPTCEDWDLLMRLALRYHFGYIDETLVDTRVHSQHRLTKNVELMSVGYLAVLDKIKREVPDRFRAHLRAQAYQLYSPLIFQCLNRRDFLAAESMIYKIAKEAGPQTPRPLIIKLYILILTQCLIDGDFQAAEPIICRFSQNYGTIAMLHFILRLVVSSPLTAIQSLVPPANEKGPKAAVRLALRKSIHIVLRS